MVKITGSVSFSAADTYNCINYDCIIEWVEENVFFNTCKDLVKLLKVVVAVVCAVNINITELP